jgi:Fur family peroxide stress response transcriptional regulator
LCAFYSSGTEGPIKTLARELAAKGVRASHQRLRVLAYLREHRNHPTAEEVYEHVLEEIPTLSRATVYNTLHLYAQTGLVRVVDTVAQETRYDDVLELHGHFRCDRCGSLVDFPIDVASLTPEGLFGYRVRERHVTYKGLCPSCFESTA